MKIVECIPNFSEGRSKEIIDAIVREIRSISGAILLDVDPGYDANRTVITFAGEPEPVAEAAFKAIAMAQRLIDMRFHKGAHPRLGSTCVCPFVPVKGISMEECVKLSKEVAKRVGEELGIPVYLYEESSNLDYRKKLADIRRGEYEGLKEKIKDPKWRPDFGPVEFNERSGATVIGARQFLIAYNVNLNTQDVSKAKRIASQVREGKEGGLKACRAIGWYMPSYGCAQVSMNLVDYTVTPIHAAFEEVSRIAQQEGLRVTGSEMVGLVPLSAILDAGRFYLQRQGRSPGLSQEEIIDCAIKSLGLNDVIKFEPSKKILEFRLFEPPLKNLTSANFLDLLSTDSPVPAGGSAGAFAGAMGAGLVAMIANISYKKQKDSSVRRELGLAAIQAQELKERFARLVIEDEEAFKKVVEVKKAKKGKGNDLSRQKDYYNAFIKCIEVPMEGIRKVFETLRIFQTVLNYCPASMISDAGAALNCLKCCAETQKGVVRINLSGVSPLTFEYVRDCNKQLNEIMEQIYDLLRILDDRIEKFSQNQ